MPLVVIQYRGGFFSEYIVRKFAESMPKIVAEALHVPENEQAHLLPSDIEIWTQESSRLDVNTKDIEIIIWANSYPERLANLEQRKDVILQVVRKFFSDYYRGITGFVWILLQPGAFGEL